MLDFDAQVFAAKEITPANKPDEYKANPMSGQLNSIGVYKILVQYLFGCDYFAMLGAYTSEHDINAVAQTFDYAPLGIQAVITDYLEKACLKTFGPIE